MTMLAWVPGPLEWAVIGIIALLLFGRRLPEVGKSLGKGIVEFKKGMREATDEVTKPAEEPAPAPRVDPVAEELAKLRAEIERMKADRPSPPPTNN